MKKKINPFKEIEAGLKKACGDYGEPKDQQESSRPYNTVTTITSDQQEKWEKRLEKIMQHIYGCEWRECACEEICIDGQDCKEIKQFIKDLLTQEREQVIENQYDMMMKCLPKDAENLSTLTPDQAFRLIKCFISKHPWNY